MLYNKCGKMVSASLSDTNNANLGSIGYFKTEASNNFVAK